MNKAQFKHDFLRGLDSALIELNSNCNPKQFREIVMYGCLHNTAYDMQCEGDRGWYLYQAAQLVEDKEAIVSAIIHKFIHYKYSGLAICTNNLNFVLLCDRRKWKCPCCSLSEI